MFNSNDFGDDTLDLGDLIEREEEILDADDAPSDDDWAFIRSMKELRSEFYGDLDDHARNGATLIHERYFEEYAQELAESIGAIDPDADWPANRIDWEAAAEDLKIDYTEFDVSGETYYTRDF